MFQWLKNILNKDTEQTETQKTHMRFLSENIGIETAEGSFIVVLKKGLPLPCERTEIFTTATDNQDILVLHVLKGSTKSVSEPGTKDLGRYSIREISPARMGIPQIEVNFVVNSKDTFILSAREGNKDLKIEVK